MLAYDLLLALGVALYAAVAIAYLRHPAASALHPATIYLAFHGLIFVFRPVLARIFHFDFIYQLYEFQPTPGDKITVLLAANLGFLTFMGSCLWIARDPIEFTQDEFDDRQRRLMRKPFLLMVMVLAPIAIWSSWQTWSDAASGASTMIQDATTRIRINTETNGYFHQVQTVLASLTAIFAWIFRFRIWALMPFVGFFILRAGTGGRGPFVIAAIALIILYLFENRRRWPEWRSALLIAVIAVAFNFVVADRGKAIRSIFIEDNAQVSNSDKGLIPFEGMDFANMEYFEFIVWAIPQRTGTYSYFVENLQLFTEPIPRVWWPEKPVGAPITFYNLFDYGNPIGMTSSLPGSGWASWGYLGVIIQCGLFGIFYGGAYRYLLGRRRNNLLLLTYAVIVAATVVTYRDGVLLTIARQTTFYFLPVLVMWLFMRLYNVPSANALRARWLHVDTSPASTADGRDFASLTPAQRRRRLAALDAG